MHLLPHRDVEIESAATPESLQATLEAATAPDRLAPRGAGGEPFAGTWRGPTFDLRPRHGPDALSTVVRGAVEPGRLHPRGSRIRGSIEVSGGTLAFLALWIGFFLYAAVRATVARHVGTTDGWAWLIPWAMVTVAWGMLLLGFGMSARRTERRLRQLAAAAAERRVPSPHPA